MELQDLILVSVDDHLIEPEDMFETRTSVRRSGSGRRKSFAGRAGRTIGWSRGSARLVLEAQCCRGTA